MTTPNVTPAQLYALLTFVVGQVVAFGWLSAGDGQLAVSIGSTVLAAVWKIADALIRRGRSNVAAAKVQAQSSTAGGG